MDIATFMINRRGLKLPVIEIDRTDVLADPERPAYVKPAEVANSLFVHLERGLAQGEPSSNPLWLALTSQARRVRAEQLAEDRQRVPTQTGPMSNEAVAALVTATERRDMLFAAVDAATPASERAEARARVEAAAVANAFRKRGEAVRSLGAGPEAKAYGDAVLALSRVARAEAMEANKGLVDINEGAGENEIQAPVDPRAVTENWLRSIPATNPTKGTRWTDNFIVVMKTNEEAAVMTEFVNLAVKAVDAERTPSRDELTAAVSGLRSEFAKPVIVMRSEEIPYGEGEMTKTATRAVLARPPITSRSAEYRKSLAVANGASEEQAAALMRSAITPRGADRRREELVRSGMDRGEATRVVRGGRPLVVGFEGQNWYGESKHIKDALQAVMGKAGSVRPTVISHAPEGSNFRAALEKAAKEAGIPVVRGVLEVTRSSTITSSAAATSTRSGKAGVRGILEERPSAAAAANSGTRQHADGAYAVEPTRGVDVTTVAYVPNERGRDVDGIGGAKPRVEFDSGDGAYQTRGKLVVFDAVAKGDRGRIGEMGLVIAAANNAALTPSRLVAFYGKRLTPELDRVLKRRALSGRSQAFVLDKDGRRMANRKVKEMITDRTMTPHERRVDAVQGSRDWRFDRPTATLLATAVVGADAAASLREFTTIGQAMDAARRVMENPKGGKEIAKDVGVSLEAMRAAVKLESASRDTEDYQRKANSALARVKNVREEDGTSLLVDVKDAMVAKHGAMVGFSAPAAREAPVGSRVAIVGDERPVSPALAGNIDKMVAELGEKFGRDADGVARGRITTTLSSGVGEAVMDAAIKHKVPFEAIGHKDDRGFVRGSDDMRLFAKAYKASEAGLGGTWSMNTYGANEPERTLAMAAHTAMTGADAVVVARAQSRDPLTMVAGAVGHGKSVVVMAPSDPNPAAYSGNRLLATPSADLTVSWSTKRGSPIQFTEGAHVQSVHEPIEGQRAYRAVTHATLGTGAGAPELRSNDGVGMVVAAARRDVDLSLNRNRGEVQPDRVRLEVMEKVDMERVGDRGYMEKLKLNAREAEHVGRMHAEWVSNEVHRVFAPSPNQGKLAELLGERLRAAPERQTPSRASAGMER